MSDPFSAILGAVAGPVIGGLLGSEADATQATEQSQTTQQPWAPMQPYLIGGAQPPSYLYGTPDLYGPWLPWAQDSGAGTTLAPPPPMMMDYVRAQQGIGTVDGQPATEADRVGSMPAPAAAPQQAPQGSAAPLAYWTPAPGGGYVSNDPGFGAFPLTPDVLADNAYLRQPYETRQNVLQGNLDQYNELHSLLAP